ncbi:hypothetical protein CYMTET_20328 [Cymbomonas tetramitiformis]|uniref:Uncharacterized protein n=1 Tax=Cymbomonas tetramitiformis TaxID=36881 RepID=A0AAE0G4A0_9CHLO|nr:hypothetical protein CYMTET_20328 [Cymbomonas tetramitiformis]
MASEISISAPALRTSALAGRHAQSDFEISDGLGLSALSSPKAATKRTFTPNGPGFLLLIVAVAALGLLRLTMSGTHLEITEDTAPENYQQTRSRSSLLTPGALAKLRGGKRRNADLTPSAAATPTRSQHARPSKQEPAGQELAGQELEGGEAGEAPEDVEEPEDESNDQYKVYADVPIGTVKGPWRWTGTCWRRVDPSYEGDSPSNPLSWFDRRSVQARLDFDKFINCPKDEDAKGEEPPTLEGLPVRSTKLRTDDFIVHQGNFEKFGKGENANRTDRIRRAEILPLDGENTLKQHYWGNCAIVGNSGILRLTEFARSIDSHDTVVRLNVAPNVEYARRVGHKTTHRLLNRLWTRTYRNGGGTKKGQALPMEQDLTFMISRANSQEYELLQEYLVENRPDVKALYLSSRATSMAQPLLTAYRQRMCENGYGPFKGLNVPSSGYVAIHMLQRLCDRVTVYGFGVTGMGNCQKCGLPKSEGGLLSEKYLYHYYKASPLPLLYLLQFVAL